MLCKTPALLPLHLLHSLSDPQMVSVKVCVSGSGARLCERPWPRRMRWQRNVCPFCPYPYPAQVLPGVSEISSAFRGMGFAIAKLHPYTPAAGRRAGIVPQRDMLMILHVEIILLEGLLYPTLQDFCLLEFCMIKKNLDFNFFHSEKLSFRGVQGGRLFRLQIHRITAYWEAILDVGCVGSLYIGPVLFPYEGMFWQSLALFYFFKKRKHCKKNKHVIYGYF